MQAAAYIRVSTDEQAKSGLGLEAQKDRIMEEGGRRGWELEWFVDDGYSAGTLTRPALMRALQGLQDGRYGVLVASKLDRLSRSALDLASLLQRSQDQRWSLVLLDMDLDTSKPSGKLVAHVMGAVAEFERARISERTKEALAMARARGVRLGRPPTLDPKTAARVRRMRATGASLRTIADKLNDANVPRPQGGRWHPTTVARTLG